MSPSQDGSAQLSASQSTKSAPAAEPESSAAETFQFVNLSHPEGIRKNKSVRTAIRRHVMKDIGQQRRKHRKKTKSPPTELSSAKQTEYSNVSSPSRSIVFHGGLPIEANARIRELLHFNNASSHHYQPLRNAWIQIALTDSAAFHVTMGNTAAFLAKITGDDHPFKNPEIVGHYSRSVSLLRQRLKNPLDIVREGTVANILAHICLSIRFNDWDSWRVHMDGLSLVSTLRGGLEDLGHRMPTLILLHDLSGNMVFDLPPRFPLPLDVLATRQRTLRDVPPRLQSLLLQVEQLPHHISMVSFALATVSSIADVVNLNSYSKLFWENDMEAIALLAPCIHFLLSIPRLPPDFRTQPNMSDLVMREVMRLVCLLIMSQLKGRFGLPTSEQAGLRTKLTDLVEENGWCLEGKYHELGIWAIVTAALLYPQGEKDLFVQQIQHHMTVMGYNQFREVVDLAQEIIWINVLESPCVAELTHDIETSVIESQEL